MLAKMISVGTALTAICAAWGQTTASPSFDVASVKPATPAPWRESKAGVDRIDFPNVTLRYCIAFGYRVKEYQISGPSWLGIQRYDILAKGPEGTHHDLLPDMMQHLLEDRFQLQIHREKKEFNVIALIAGKNGPKLREASFRRHAGRSEDRVEHVSHGVGRMEVKEGNMAALPPRFRACWAVP